MVQQVTDTASHRRDQIANLAEMLRNRILRQSLVKEVYFGKKREKSVIYLAEKLGITPKRVTEIGKPLVNSFFAQSRIRENGKATTVYLKEDSVQHNIPQILKLANNKKQFDAYHTKTNPKIRTGGTVKIVVPFRPRVRSITIDDVKEFSKIQNLNGSIPKLSPARLPEKNIKKGLIRILGEKIDPKDWGGESNDIFTTRITISGHRRRAAFALKGPAKSGPLTPKMMGKNGDQIQRLFASPAQVFFVQYEGEIKQSILDQMSQLALAKAITEQGVFYGVIDLQDTYRLRLGYPNAFKN